MEKTIIKNAKLLNGEICDILIIANKIAQIAPCMEDDVAHLIELNASHYVSSGWIDLHTHCFKKFELYGDDIDSVGYRLGATTIVDAGTAGSDTIDEFYQQSKGAKTHVLAFMNIAKQGICAQDELSNLDNLDQPAFLEKAKKYPDFIVGLKARMSRSVLQGSGNVPLDIARSLSDQLHLPIMVHIGNEPAKLEDIFERLCPGDIVTHIFNPKENGILDTNGEIKDFVKAGQANGLYYDLGHGSESFSFNTASLALKQGMKCDSISTDIYFHNRIKGPVYSLGLTMSKMLDIGYSLEEVIERVTMEPAKILNRPSMGKMMVGELANLTIFDVANTEVEVEDSLHEKVKLQRLIQPIAVVIDGTYMAL